MANFYFQFLLYLMHGVAFILTLCSRDFSGFVFPFEVWILSSAFILFFNTKEFVYGAVLTFFYLLSGSLVLLATAGKQSFYEVAPQGVHFYLLLTSIFITAGVFPFSFLVSYCNSNVVHSSILYLQSLATKLPFIVILKIFPHTECLDKNLFLFSGIITVAYAIIFIPKISFGSIIAIVPYVALPFVFFFTDFIQLYDKFYDFVICFLVLFSAILMIIFYRNEEPNRLFAYMNTVFAGILTIATAYLGNFGIVILSGLSSLFTIIVLFLRSRKGTCSRVNSPNLELLLIKKIRSSSVKLLHKIRQFYGKKIIKLELSCEQKYKKGAIKIQRFFGKTGLRYLHVDSIECNILLSVLFVTFSFFFLVFYVF